LEREGKTELLPLLGYNILSQPSQQISAGLDEEGLYLGASSALNVAAAKQVAEKMGPGNTIVTILCDGAYRYADRLFSKKWLEQKNLTGAIPKHLEKYIVLP